MYLTEANFVPLPPHELSKALHDFEKFIHAETQLPLLIKIALVHAQFETIHPFLVGKGRIGRLLNCFLLYEKKVLSKPVLYLSYYFKRYRHQYYELLQAVRDKGDWGSWVIFFLQGILEISQQATLSAMEILKLREKQREVIAEKLGRSAGNGHRVLECFFQTTILSVVQIQNLLYCSYPVANNLVIRLVECGILQEYTEQKRNRRFIYRKYIHLPESEPQQI